MAQKTSSDDEDYSERGAALTIDDTADLTFVVYSLGSCEFAETQLAPATNSKSIQKCVLTLSNKPQKEEPILMKVFDEYIQFIDIKTNTVMRSQPIQTIKTWAVDDDNNFAFVIEDETREHLFEDDTVTTDRTISPDDAPLIEPLFRCHVFNSIDDDDMSCKVAAKLNEGMTRQREQMSDRILKSTRIQQMIEQTSSNDGEIDVAEFDELEASNESTMDVKYIGHTNVSRPVGIDVLNTAIDKCYTEASKVQPEQNVDGVEGVSSSLINAKLHVSPSSVIVENEISGEIIVECRIRYLTFIGISKRDIRHFGFIMQIPTNKTFQAHCFECQPTAGYVCEAIQLSCTKMYEKVVKKSNHLQTMSIIPNHSNIRSTVAKMFSRIKLNPILNG